MATNENTQVATMDSGYSIMPRNMEAQINEAKLMRTTIERLLKELLVLDTDFGRIPGTDKPTLYKPGAEILCKVFRLAQGKADMIDKSEDWEKGILSYTVGMSLVHIDSGAQIAYGVGAANGLEKKHRYRKAKDENGKEIQIENPDPADLQNTLIKMANKRAFVDAVLKATGASRFFTQDAEEFGAITGQFEKASSKQIDFMKKLFGGSATEAAIMAEISSICGREVKSFEDIRRAEASKIIDVKKKSGSGAGKQSSGGGYGQYPSDDEFFGGYDEGMSAPPPAASGPALSCDACGSPITKAEQGYSKNKYGRPLCRTCQTAVAAQGA